jgi:hypothetical protein
MIRMKDWPPVRCPICGKQVDYPVSPAQRAHTGPCQMALHKQTQARATAAWQARRKAKKAKGAI